MFETLTQNFHSNPWECALPTAAAFYSLYLFFRSLFRRGQPAKESSRYITKVNHFAFVYFAVIFTVLMLVKIPPQDHFTAIGAAAVVLTAVGFLLTRITDTRKIA